MRRFFLGAALCLICLPAAADDQSAFIAKALAELQRQRNSAADDAVNAKAEAGINADKLALALQQIKAAGDKADDLTKKVADLEKQLADLKPDAKVKESAQ